MKTLKSISLALLFVATVAFASAKEVSTALISSESDLRNSFREMIVNDFSGSNGYLYKHDVSSLENNVEITFFITLDKEIRILKIASNNEVASEYIKQLLNTKQLNIRNDMAGKAYKLDIQLVYKAH